MTKIFTLLLFCFSSTLLLAQPDEHIGCHHPTEKYEPVPGFLPTIMNVDDTRSDSIDILNYEINVDLTGLSYLVANTVVTASPLVDNIDEIILDLLQLQIDSVFVDGEKVTFTYDGFQTTINLEKTFNTGDVFDVHVFYQGNPERDPSGFGGLVYEQGYLYNLGIGLASNPHNFGRGWFPCFDNFMERSTYDINMLHLSSMNAHAVGTELSIVDNQDGTILTSYAMEQPITTYQTSISAADYHTMWSEHEGMDGTIPIKLMAKPQDSTAMKNSMGNLPATLDCIESWYGPYVWERVGYVATTVGAMEHPTHIAYPISSINGNATSNTRLMSHELTHNWFGNLITLSTERDMWIKEGPAEYGWHLTAECLYGKEEFLEVVKDNHLYVLEKAHTDDDGFRSLSGMPNEHTYGTHTYRKGASVIHNIRGYLGDTLFSKGMKSILENYEYSHLDADEFRDQLTQSTGIDMSDFFDGWIFNAGFSVFVDDSLKTVEMGSGDYETTIYVQQKNRGTDFFHKSVPLTIHAYGFAGEVEETSVQVSNQYDEVNIGTTFPVKRVVFNRDNLLNQARMAEDMLIEAEENYKFDRTDVTLRVKELDEPFLARVEHIYGAPDNNIIEGDFELSRHHYWRISGDFPSEYLINTSFPYDGKSFYDLDYPINIVSEDSTLLFYRPDATYPWAPVEDFDLVKVIPNDGNGSLKIDQVLPGEYTVGKGVLEVSSVNEEEQTAFQVMPNPATDIVYLYPEKQNNGSFSVKLYTLDGVLISCQVSQNQEYYSINTSSLASGQYFVELTEEKSGKRTTKKLVIVQ